MGDVVKFCAQDNEPNVTLDALTWATAMMRVRVDKLPQIPQDYIKLLCGTASSNEQKAAQKKALAHWAQWDLKLPCPDKSFRITPEVERLFAMHALVL